MRPESWRLASLVVVVVVGLLLPHRGDSLSCQRAHESAPEAEGCPVKTARHPSVSNCVSVQVRIQHADLSLAPTIEITSLTKETIRPVFKYKRTRKKNGNEIQVLCHESSERPGPHVNATLSSVMSFGLHFEPLFDTPTGRRYSGGGRWSFFQWELLIDCVETKGRLPLSVSYSAASVRCSLNYTLPEAVADFSVSVDRASKSINVTVLSESKVLARWCYKQSAHYCVQRRPSNITVMDPSRSRWALLGFPFLLPCVCVQVFSTHADPLRKTACPLQGLPIADAAADVWPSSAVTLYRSSLTLSSACPARDFPVSASLCWRRHPDVCVPSPDSSLLAREDGTDLIFDISAVDRHPRICVKFSLGGSHNVSCPFRAETPSWRVSLRAGPSIDVESSAAATFRAQACVPSAGGCAARGPVRAVAVEAASAGRIHVPLGWAGEGACVQVWQSSPALKGRRILCPHRTRGRRGARAAAAFFLLAALAFSAVLLRSLVTKRATARLSIGKPVLLVCSSWRHVSAARALASLLGGDLNATVHLALGGAGGVADLGPLPWLYGRWEAVREARGKVLIVWSPEANRTYGKWRRRWRGDEAHGPSPRQPEKDGADERPADVYRPSAVIPTVFEAALTCLEGAQRRRQGREVALVYFRGLGRSGDIPRSFRNLPRYGLPRDLARLVRELGGPRATEKTPRWRCLRRLLSTGASVWLERRLAHRLRTPLPPVQKKSRFQKYGFFRVLPAESATDGAEAAVKLV
ncbi:interleukin-17 receptor E-like isoform X2 [Hippocampus zosterae]|uniref:interleukin-17 receptor E-like isoform X2 n=1 Tax=Hippocampus zosterae TaxID=109293 RepID=UPI00223D993F|nr:interleukin-17 receptor E-like isoform X2 [Hippocampus zosterae]